MRKLQKRSQQSQITQTFIILRIRIRHVDLALPAHVVKGKYVLLRRLIWTLTAIQNHSSTGERRGPGDSPRSQRIVFTFLLLLLFDL
jgi:hypothetical protein